MVAQQDGHDFALVHLPFAVSHSLISLVYGGDMDRSKTACNLPFFLRQSISKCLNPLKSI